MPQVLPEDLKTVLRLEETSHERLAAISFFLLGIAVSAALVRLLWNCLAQDFKSLPRLSYPRALALVTLWGLLFIIVLTMISGARELMTPGAWKKQGLTYTLDESAQEPSLQNESKSQPSQVHLLRSMRKHVFWLVCGSIVCAVLAWRAADPSGELGTDLLFGWAYFIVRVLIKAHIRWDGVAILAGALGAAVLIFHFFMRWLLRAVSENKASSERRWRWTLMLTALTIVLFIAGISMIGAAHQTAWLLQSDKPIFGKDVVLP